MPASHPARGGGARPMRRWALTLLRTEDAEFRPQGSAALPPPGLRRLSLRSWPRTLGGASSGDIPNSGPPQAKLAALNAHERGDAPLEHIQSAIATRQAFWSPHIGS